MESITYTNCSNCDKPLPQTGFFCGVCLIQFKCKVCGASLEKEYAGCVNCGEAKQTKTTVSSASMNTIRIHEKQGERSIEAAFSDNIGKELTNMLRDAYTLRTVSKLSDMSSEVENYTPQQDYGVNIQPNVLAKDIHAKDTTTTLNPPENFEIMHIDDVERSIECSEPHWILLYSFYISEYGKNIFNKKIIFNKYKEARGTDTRMGNFSTNWNNLFPSSIKTVKTDEFRLTENGIKTVKDILAGKLSSPSATKTGIKKTKEKKDAIEGEKKQITKKSAVGSNTLKKLTDINFYPDGKDSLEKFYKKFKVTNDYENNLLFVYYLQETLKINPITANHLYTCYDALNIRIPEDLVSGIKNTKRAKGWIESKVRGNLSVTVVGINKIKFWDKNN